jgi:predicted ATPase
MTKISINNFRSFKNQNFSFSKVNILIGENSSGKSSFLKFLLAVKQTTLNKFSNFKLYGDFVDLGNYDDVIYYHNFNDSINFKFEFGLDYSRYYFGFFTQFLKEDGSKSQYVKNLSEKLNGVNASNTSLEVTINEHLDDHANVILKFHNDLIGTLTINHNPNSENNELTSVMGGSDKCKLTFNGKKGDFVLEDIDYQPEGFFSLILSASLRSKCEAVLPGDYEFFYSITFLLVFQNYLSNYFQRLRFVNPFNAKPQRFHYTRDREKSNVISIETIMDILGDKNLKEPTREELLRRLNSALQSFGLADGIEFIRSERNNVVEIRAKIQELSSNLTDVGYGVSLQLPVLFAAITSQIVGGETILIEQPEIHLHPKLQANFIETLIGAGSDNTYFIETHSEHIIRRLQVMIKKKEFGLNPEDVTIHYFRKENRRFLITSHKIDGEGKLDPNFPSGFYDNSYTLARQLL